jgi:hypothetical protein
MIVAREPYGLVPPITINPRDVVDWQRREHFSDEIPQHRRPVAPREEIEAAARHYDSIDPPFAAYLRRQAEDHYGR